MEEKQIIRLIAMDRIDVTLSSLDNKLRKQRSNLAEEVAEDVGKQSEFVGKRTYARTDVKDKRLARGMKVAIEEFEKEFPLYGKILRKKIAEKRDLREEHLYFGTRDSSRIAGQDYLEVLTDLGISEHQAHMMYPLVIEASRKIQQARNNQERSAIVGKYVQN